VSANLLKAGRKRRWTKQEIEDELEVVEKEKKWSRAKLDQYDLMKSKCEMQEAGMAQGKGAINLLQQFVATGFVTQEDDGSFVIPGVSD